VDHIRIFAGRQQVLLVDGFEYFSFTHTSTVFNAAI